MLQDLSLPDRGKVLDSPAMEKSATKIAALREHYLFAGLDDADFESLMQRASVVRVEKGAVLFHRGDKADDFYFIDSGQVELNIIAPTGQKKVLEVVGPDRTFAEAVAFMGGHKYPVTCEVLSDAVLVQIPNNDYVDLIDTDRDACMRLLSDISRHLHGLVREIERLTVQNAGARLVSYLLEHVVDTNDDEATIRLELPRHVIASRLSITPETLSRLLRGLVDERIITIEDRVIFVHNLSRLRPYD